MRSVVQHLFCRNHVPVEPFTNQPDMLTHVGRDSMNQTYHKTTLRKLTLQWNINYSSMGCIFHVSFFLGVPMLFEGACDVVIVHHAFPLWMRKKNLLGWSES